MANLDKSVVPMPPYVDPNNPKAAGGSVNMTLDEHPVDHAEDYGAAVEGSAGATAASAEEQDYEDMTNEELKAEAKKRGLSGYSTYNKDELVVLLETDDDEKS